MCCKNVGESFVRNLVKERQKNGEFKSLRDFASRMIGELNKRSVECLIKSGAFDSLPGSRAQKLEIFEEIIKTIFDNLPRCNWCGKLFKPTKNNYKYCNRTIKGKKCSEWGWEENNRRNNREYYKRNKDQMTEKQRNGLGSKNAYLSGKPEQNPLAELEKVRKAKKSLGLKPL